MADNETIKATVEFKLDKEQIEKIVQESMRDYELQINEIRNEAIQEFAEMLKTKNEDFCVDKGDMAFYVDNLVKEFMEGENG